MANYAFKVGQRVRVIAPRMMAAMLDGQLGEILEYSAGSYLVVFNSMRWAGWFVARELVRVD